MYSHTERYVVVAATARSRVTCPGCLKKRYIQHTFTQTVNPFNKNEDGSVKTGQEVWESVKRQAKAWKPSEPDRYHQKCWEAKP